MTVVKVSLKTIQYFPYKKYHAFYIEPLFNSIALLYKFNHRDRSELILYKILHIIEYIT